MLPQLETLHTIAEVGIAITGFAGIVAAVERRAGGTAHAFTGSSLSQLLGTSLGTVFFCFVPEWLDAAIASPDAVWQVSLGLFGVYRLIYIGTLIVAGRREGWAGLRPWLFLVGISLGALHLLAATGVLAQFHYFLYLTGLT